MVEKWGTEGFWIKMQKDSPKQYDKHMIAVQHVAETAAYAVRLCRQPRLAAKTVEESGIWGYEVIDDAIKDVSNKPSRPDNVERVLNGDYPEYWEFIDERNTGEKDVNSRCRHCAGEGGKA